MQKQNKSLAPSTTLNPRRRSEHQPLPEWLHLSGLVYSLNREILRDQALEAECRELRAGPTLSSGSKLITRGEKRDVLQRMEQHHQEARTRLETMRSKQLDREQAFTFQPIISGPAQHKHRQDQYAISTEWTAKRDGKVERERQRQFANEALTLQPVTRNRRSVSLASKNPDRRGLSVEEWLLAADQRRRIKLRALEDARESPSRSPSITPRAAALRRPGDVGSRLFGIARAKQQHAENEEPSDADEPPPRHAMQLYKKCKEAEQRLSARVQELEALEDTLHHPEIDAVSKELVAHLPSSSWDRLCYGRRPRSSNTTGNRNPSPPTFRPILCTNSLLLESAKEADGLGDHEDRVDLWEHQWRQREERLAAMRRDKEARGLRECTFAPVTTGCTGLGPEPSSKERIGEVAERTLAWQQQRDAKREARGKELAAGALEGCTFRPDHRLATIRPAPPVGVTAEGVQEFLARQRRARKQEEALRARENPEVQWTPDVTIPKEFNLSYMGHRRRSSSVDPVHTPYGESRTSSVVHAPDARRTGNHPRTSSCGRNRRPHTVPGILEVLRGTSLPPRATSPSSHSAPAGPVIFAAEQSTTQPTMPQLEQYYRSSLLATSLADTGPQGLMQAYASPV